MPVWVIDADDDGYCLTVDAFVQRLPVFVGILHLAGLEVRYQGWTYRLRRCVSVCVWKESSESVLILYFLCGPVLNSSERLNGDTLFCFVWHLNKVHLTLQCSFCVFSMFYNLHAHCPNTWRFINETYLTRTCYGEEQKHILQFVWISTYTRRGLFSVRQVLFIWWLLNYLVVRDTS